MWNPGLPPRLSDLRTLVSSLSFIARVWNLNRVRLDPRRLNAVRTLAESVFLHWGNNYASSRGLCGPSARAWYGRGPWAGL